MWANEFSICLIQMRLNKALRQFDFTNIYVQVFKSNKITEYCNILLDLMATDEIKSFNHQGLTFLDTMITEGYYNPLSWLTKNYKNYDNSSTMNVIQHVLISVKQREEKVNEYKKILNEVFGDVGRYVVSQYL
jgi:hypothetical protein